MRTDWRWMAVAAVIAAAGAVVPAPAADRPDNPHVWKSRVTSVAVFKNGLGFFVRSGEVSLRDGWCIAGEAPPATFGTLAIYAHDPAQAVDIIGSGPGEVVEFDGRDASDDPAAIRSRLEASTGLDVQLSYLHHGADRTAAGSLVSVGPDFAILEGRESTFAVPLAAVRRMQVLELPMRIHVAGDPEAGNATLGMAYLRKGITWIPEYTLRILDDQTAELTLRGTIINEAEDLVHCDVQFVVGVPHFLHTDYLAPIAVGQVIRTIGSSMAPREVQLQIANRAAITTNNFRADQFGFSGEVIERPAGGEAGNLDAALGNLPAIEPGGATDYTVYTQPDMTLRRGEKAIVTLFTKKIRYGHIYRWSPPGSIEHFLVLQNDTDTAWTTGPYLALSGNSPLSEDLLRYVPKGGRGEVPVTTAINIATEQTSRELDRQFKAHEPADRFFLDLVTLEGQLKVRNFEKRPVTLVVDANVPGKPLSASNDGAISIDASKLQLLERAGRVQWTLTLDPGETKTLTYQYEKYVPSHGVR